MVAPPYTDCFYPCPLSQHHSWRPTGPDGQDADSGPLKTDLCRWCPQAPLPPRGEQAQDYASRVSECSGLIKLSHMLTLLTTAVMLASSQRLFTAVQLCSQLMYHTTWLHMTTGHFACQMLCLPATQCTVLCTSCLCSSQSELFKHHV